MPHHITIISDPVCPWCFIGYHRLKTALRNNNTQAKITFQPFELNPDMPTLGMPRQDYVMRKFGTQGKAFYANIRATAAADGLNLELDQITHMPATRQFHQLVAWLKEFHPAQVEAFMGDTFKAFFEDGAKIDAESIQNRILGKIGIPEKIQDIDLDDYRQEVLDYRKFCNKLEVSGVPFFIIDDQKFIPGAITVAAWQKILSKIRR